MKHAAFKEGPDRDAILEWFDATLRRTACLFEIPKDEVYFSQPISLRNPIVFYEGHLPSFSINTLLKLGMRKPGIDEAFEVLFARGIDPEIEASGASPEDLWPKRPAVQAYVSKANALLRATLADDVLDDHDVPVLRGGEALFTVLEHELMHQETLLYMLHNLRPDQKNERDPLNGRAAVGSGGGSANDLVAVPGGMVTLGVERDEIGFAWDNESPMHREMVEAFSMQRHNVSNGEFMEFVSAGGYENEQLWSRDSWEWVTSREIAHPQFWTRRDDGWFWRSMFRNVPLPLDWPVYVTHAEAEAYARWKGMRLPAEAEYHRAAFGTPSGEEREFPWGNQGPDSSRGNFDFRSWDPVAVGSYPAGVSAWGIHDLVGNGWEWTSTVFEGFPGFSAMPSYPLYSADFFDGKHFVLKGASPATARELIRRSFRNWFRPAYPYVYAAFRCVTS